MSLHTYRKAQLEALKRKVGGEGRFVSHGEAMADMLERSNSKGFILRTREGEFQYTPSGFGEMERDKQVALQKVGKRMFTPKKKRVLTN